MRLIGRFAVRLESLQKWASPQQLRSVSQIVGRGCDTSLLLFRNMLASEHARQWQPKFAAR